MPWGRLKGAVPGYPAAAARPFNSSCKIVKKPTVSRRGDGCVVTLWRTAIRCGPPGSAECRIRRGGNSAPQRRRRDRRGRFGYRPSVARCFRGISHSWIAAACVYPRHPSRQRRYGRGGRCRRTFSQCREGMPVSNRDREQKFAIPCTGLDRGRNRTMVGRFGYWQMADGWLGKFNLRWCLGFRVLGFSSLRRTRSA
jgi:hypothetical protein